MTVLIKQYCKICNFVDIRSCMGNVRSTSRRTWINGTTAEIFSD